ITGKEINPSRDWLNPAAHYLKTSEALHKVRNWFKRQEQSKYLAMGQTQWEKLARREGVPKNLAEKALPFFKFKNLAELYIAIGSGNLGAISVLHRVRPEELKKELVPEKLIEKPVSIKTGEFQLEGTANLLTQLARCCKPIPGDAILGYITKGRGISIHQQSCRNIQYISKKHPERLFLVSWGKETKDIYPVEIQIEAEDRAGLVRDISNVIAAHHLSLLGLTTQVDKLKNLAYIKIHFDIPGLDLLNKILQQLSQVPGVVRIHRR
ncbi:MAG: bifunctional (p)ppGpp synthetase/guanosine-3',5'-bis(diphosphate) 3'-pyrophosphohydrolase, partial [Proteobacteria bacterium]|nr:bifunctional (p)ppGpp synthetase/guanosine-3',5'-bis(diphosphate) 3'-pyrophosphohydrolase [Pseudomonadota bacterium]